MNYYSLKTDYPLMRSAGRALIIYFEIIDHSLNRCLKYDCFKTIRDMNKETNES